MAPKVICEKADHTDIPTIDKKKYLVPSVRVCCIMTPRRLFQCSLLVGFDCWSVRLCYPEENQVGAGEGHLHLCRGGTSPDGGTHERHLRGAQVRPLF